MPETNNLIQDVRNRNYSTFCRNGQQKLGPLPILNNLSLHSQQIPKMRILLLVINDQPFLRRSNLRQKLRDLIVLRAASTHLVRVEGLLRISKSCGVTHSIPFFRTCPSPPTRTTWK